ncbi:MAG TPA: serine/threonine-protein kinase [Planctomycetota bacterium]|nr:serine/threonine-protein kinase [Planctomycetota bacterium]
MSTETQTLAHRFGDVAKDMGLLNDQQIDAAMAKQQTLKGSGARSRIGEVLIMMNVLNVEQVKKILSEQRKRRQADADKVLPMEYFGEFKLLQKLGEGAMGAVYKAQETLAQRTVALKVLRTNLAGNKGFVERFDRESKMIGGLSHPNIVACHSAGTARGVQYMVMEFVDGETLKTRLKRSGGKLPEREALKVCHYIAQGLAHAHSKGIVHRDIKPDNILLGKDGSVKISDFGTAKSFLDEDSLSMTGTIIGTPHYISPEQVRADKDIDHRADLYALGGTLYHLLTGHVPFDASSPLEIMRRHLHDELENPSDINAELSPGAVQIVTKLMAKDRKERYQSADEAVEDIKRVLDAKDPLHATLEQNKSSIRPPKRKRAKKKGAAGCAGMVVLVLLLFFAS